MTRALLLLALLTSACLTQGGVNACANACKDRGIDSIGVAGCVCGPRPRVCPGEGAP